MGLAISTLCQLGTADEHTVAFVRSLWIGYFKNTVLEHRGHMDRISYLEARVCRLMARPSDRQTLGYITTGGHAPRRQLATRAVRAGADPSDSDSNSDSNSDSSDEPVDTDIGVASGWAEHVPDFGVIVMFIHFMKKSAEQMHLERAILDACDELEQEHRVSSSQ
jgi:hypothetical protein